MLAVLAMRAHNFSIYYSKFKQPVNHFHPAPEMINNRTKALFCVDFNVVVV